MRLIDADELINILEWNKGQDRDALVSINNLIKLVKARPTAYDVDKVVEQLRNEKEFWSDATYNKEIGKQKARSYEHAIEIVKGGEIDGLD